MKLLSNTIVLMLCLAGTLHSDAFNAQYAAIPLIHDLKLQQQSSLYRLYVIPAIIGVVALSQLDNISRMISKHPFAFACMAYLLSNVAIDTYSKYQNIHYTIRILCFAQSIHYYQLCLCAVHNTMQQQAQRNNVMFNPEQLTACMKKYLKHEMSDLQEFTQALIRNSLLFTHDVRLSAYLEAINKQLYDFSAQNVCMDQLLAVSQHDQHFCCALQQFNQDPENHIETIIAMIGTKIDRTLQEFFSEVSVLNQCAITKELS